MKKSKIVLLVFSILLNAVFIVIIISALFGKKTSILFSLSEEVSPSSMTSAMIINVPFKGGVVFNTVELILQEGESAGLQFSGIVNGKQANWIMETLYDHKIIEVKKSGFGIVIKALSAGETVMQTLSEDGFRDVAFIKVIE